MTYPLKTNMHELQSLLLQKLPRLSELKPWCKIEYEWEIWDFCCKFKTTFAISIGEKGGIIDYTADYKIIWNDFNHVDLLEALWDYWAMNSEFQLMKFVDCEIPWYHEYKVWLIWDAENDKRIKLPQNLADLSLPEYEETRKQLIQLLMK